MGLKPTGTSNTLECDIAPVYKPPPQRIPLKIIKFMGLYYDRYSQYILNPVFKFYIMHYDL
jgi:hypothetical protein